MKPADQQETVREFLQQCLSPEALAFMDDLIARIEDQIDNPQTVPEGEDPPQQDMMVQLREWLEDNLNPEQLQLLDTLISELDHGYPDEDARQDYVEAAQARQGGGAGMGSQRSQDEENDMYAQDAHDEMRDLRSRLRAAGCPVGNQPNLGALRTLARTYLRHGMAMDTRARSLSLQQMFPTIAARFAKAGSGSFAVYPDRKRHERATAARMAFDAAAVHADPALSIANMFPDIARRLKLG